MKKEWGRPPLAMEASDTVSFPVPCPTFPPIPIVSIAEAQWARPGDRGSLGTGSGDQAQDLASEGRVRASNIKSNSRLEKEVSSRSDVIDGLPVVSGYLRNLGGLALWLPSPLCGRGQTSRYKHGPGAKGVLLCASLFPCVLWPRASIVVGFSQAITAPPSGIAPGKARAGGVATYK